jgi:hypothetical protein
MAHQLPPVELMSGDRIPGSIATDEVKPSFADIETDCFDIHDDLLSLRCWERPLSGLKERGGSFHKWDALLGKKDET